MCEEICLNRLGMNLEEYSLDQIIEHARPYLFDFWYPVYDEAYRATLETKIIKHFFFREIGMETPAQFKFYLNEVLNVEMPVINRYYESAVLKFNPLYNVDYTREHTGNIDHARQGNENAYLSQDETSTHTGSRQETAQATGHAVNVSNDNVKQRYSDTPQNGLEDVENNKYLTSYQNNTRSGSDTNDSQSTTTSNGTDETKDIRNATGSNLVNRNETANTTDHYIETVQGNQGGVTYARMIMEFRESLLNVDKMVFDTLSPLFMGIF